MHVQLASVGGRVKRRRRLTQYRSLQMNWENFLRNSLSSARILAACSHILYTTLILNKSNLFAVKKNSRCNLSAEMFGGRNKYIINPDFSWNSSQWFVERTSEMLYKEILDAICIHTEQIWLRVSLLVSLSWNLTASQNIGIDLTSIPDARLSEPVTRQVSCIRNPH